MSLNPTTWAILRDPDSRFRYASFSSTSTIFLKIKKKVVGKWYKFHRIRGERERNLPFVIWYLQLAAEISGDRSLTTNHGFHLTTSFNHSPQIHSTPVFHLSIYIQLWHFTSSQPSISFIKHQINRLIYILLSYILRSSISSTVNGFADTSLFRTCSESRVECCSSVSSISSLFLFILLCCCKKTTERLWGWHHGAGAEQPENWRGGDDRKSNGIEGVSGFCLALNLWFTAK